MRTLDLNEQDTKALKVCLTTLGDINTGTCEYAIELGLLVTNKVYKEELVGFRVKVNSYVAVALGLFESGIRTKENAFYLWCKYSMLLREGRFLDSDVYFDFSVSGINPGLLKKVRSLYMSNPGEFNVFTLEHSVNGLLVSSMELDLDGGIGELVKPRTKDLLLKGGLKWLNLE